MIRFSVPGRPLGKGRPRFSRAAGRAFTPAATVSYEGKVAFFAQQAANGTGPIPAGTPVRVFVQAVFDVPVSWSKRKRADALAGRLAHTSKPDGDNVLKIVGDSLNGVLWHDDSAIADARIVKRYGEAAELVVEVEEMA